MSGTCDIRKVFTLRDAPYDTLADQVSGRPVGGAGSSEQARGSSRYAGSSEQARGSSRYAG